jgi:hypothetical protein
MFQNTEGTVTHDFRLTKGNIATRPSISGIVLLPDGQPAAGAEVALASKSFGPYVKNGHDLQQRSHPHVTTGEDGTFRFPPQVEECFVMVFHDRGYAEATEAALAAAPSRALTLREWGRVEGTLRVGTKPAADERIALYPHQRILINNRQRERPEWMDHIYFGYEATTDRMGRFAFDRVIPGPASVGRSIRVSPNSWMTCSQEVIKVEPGETAKVRIGGKGRPVIGRFVKPAESDLAIDWSHARQWLQLKRPPYRQPQGATQEERAESYQKWLETDEGKAYQAWQNDRRHHGFRIEDDGSFRIDDVTSGAYDLSLTIQDGARNNRKPLVTAGRTVVVPEMEGGQSVEPLDLGTIELVPNP